MAIGQITKLRRSTYLKWISIGVFLKIFFAQPLYQDVTLKI